jgi:hypothetical protein
MRWVRPVRQARSSVIIAAIVTIAAWIYTVSSASERTSAMPTPGGWPMSMAWMTMNYAELGDKVISNKNCYAQFAAVDWSNG